MKVYLYNGKKYYNEDDVRTAIFKKDRKVFTKAPKENAEAFWARRNVEFIEQEEDISHLKFSKKFRVKGEFQSWLKNAKLDSSLGFKIDAGTNSRNTIEDLIATLGEGDTVQFRDANNQYHELDVSMLETLKREIAQNNIFAHEQKWALDKRIADATDKEELRKIRANFVGKNFFNKE